MWSCLGDTSHPSTPSPKEQPASGLSSKPSFCSWPNIEARLRRTERCKDLRLACWNADEVRKRKLELEHFLSQHGFDNCPLIDTHLNTGQAYRFPNYVRHHRQTDRGGRYSHPGLPCYSPPFSDRSRPQTLGGRCRSSHIGRLTAENPCGIHLTLPPTDRSGPTCLFRRGIAGLMAGDLNAKQVDWMSRQTTRRGTHLRDYVGEN